MMQPTQVIFPVNYCYWPGTFLEITPVSSVSNGLYFLTVLLVSVMRVIKRNIEKVWGARYIYIVRDAEKVCGARYLPKSTVNDVEGKEKFRVEISNRFAALEDLDTEVELNSAWETIRKNIKPKRV
jgi:hypothetical protein